MDIRVAIFTQDINNIEYVTHGKERYMFNVCIYDLRAGVNLEMGLFNVQGCHACVFLDEGSSVLELARHPRDYWQWVETLSEWPCGRDGHIRCVLIIN